MKVIFAGGGTAGHVYPAVAAADRLRSEGWECLFFGGKGNIEEVIVPKRGYPITTVPLAGLKREISLSGLKKNISALKMSARAVKAAEELIKKERPDIVVGTGGYASYPLVRAASKMGIKTAVLEVNALPGFATKMLAKKADLVLCGYEEAAKRLKTKNPPVVTGSPVREEILGCMKAGHAPLFGGRRPVVASFWGSVGALYMNQKMVDYLELAARDGSFCHIHATGASAWKWMPGELKKRSAWDVPNLEVKEYIHDMERVLAGADLIICRGGGSLWEVCAAGKPVIVVPSPYAAENHQEKNARVLEQAGAAAMLKEKEICGKDIFDTVKKLLADPEKLEKMGRAALSQAKPKALGDICAAVSKLARS